WKGGKASFQGEVTGHLESPRIAGHLAVSNLNLEQRYFDSLALDIALTRSNAAISNGLLARGPMQARVSGSAGLRNWKPEENQQLQLEATVSNGDVADVMALAGKPSDGYSGSFELTARVNGTIGNPTGTVDVQARNGTIQDERFDQIAAT